MERIMAAAGRAAACLPRCVEQVDWAARRGARALSRRFGAWGWSMLACASGAVLAVAAQQYQLAAAAALQARLAAPPPTTAAALAGVAGDAAARARLRAFEQHLLAHEAIPSTLQELLDLGGREGLSMQRGEYRPQVDGAGAFLRYRMTLPVTGSAAALQRFILAALRQHPSLALEGVQLKRARAGAADVEARIEWLILSRLPARAAAAGDGGAP
jgi:hypothetical protein